MICLNLTGQGSSHLKMSFRGQESAQAGDPEKKKKQEEEQEEKEKEGNNERHGSYE